MPLSRSFGLLCNQSNTFRPNMRLKLFESVTQPRVYEDDGYHVGEIVGRRTWHVDLHTGILCSASGGLTVWMPDEEMEASCGNRCKEPPNENCPDHNGCGFYAMKPGKEDETTWGEVLLYGRYLEHEDGYRAQFAKPSRVNTTLFLNEYSQEALELVKKRYKGVEFVASW